MPANNSKTNVAIRRASALKRFSLDPAKLNDKEYQERKALEKTSLEKVRV